MKQLKQEEIDILEKASKIIMSLCDNTKCSECPLRSLCNHDVSDPYTAYDYSEEIFNLISSKI